MAQPTFAVTDNLNWTVSKRPLFFTGADGGPVEWKERVAVVRDDNNRCVGSVSPNYEILQNSALLGLIQPMVDEGLLEIKNMGYLKHGSKVFAQAKIAGEFQVMGESYESYITLLNGHDGKASVAIGPTATRVICGNTFTMAYTDLSERFRHLEGVNARVLNTKSVVDYVGHAMNRYSESVEKLASTQCSEFQFRKAMEAIYNKEESKMANIKKLNHLFYNGAGNDGRTYYDAFNAVTDFASNASSKNSVKRFQYANFGTGSYINQRAMQVLTELASV